MAKQSFKDECDINNIMDQYRRNGIVDHVSEYAGQYGDFGNSVSFHEASNEVASAKSMIMSLPSNIREEFQNDPAQFLDFVSAEENWPAMQEMGLVPREDLEGGDGGDTPVEGVEATEEPPEEPSEEV